MRVLLVNDYAVDGGWGAEAYVRRLTAGLTAAGDEVNVWAGEVSHSGAGRWRDIWDPRARRLLADRIDEWRPDIVHVHNIARECSASVLGAGDAPVVMTVHDHRLLGIPDQPGRGPRGWPQRAGARMSGAVVARVARRRVSATMAVSDELADALRAAEFPSVATVGVPVDQPVADPRPLADCRDVVFVGRLSSDKGPDVALAAFAEIADGRPDSRLLLAGDGPLLEPLQRMARPFGTRVRLLGRLGPAEVSRLIGSARVVVVPSVPTRRPEGSPTIVPEAAMHGRPLVVSDDPGLRTSAQRLGGALVTPALDVGALAAAIKQLLDDEQQALTLGTAARAAVDLRHGLPAVTAAVKAVYASALRGGA